MTESFQRTDRENPVAVKRIQHSAVSKSRLLHSNACKERVSVSAQTEKHEYRRHLVSKAKWNPIPRAQRIQWLESDKKGGESDSK